MNTVIQRLKLIKSTPTNGLAVFCGLVSTKSGGETNVDDDEGGKTKMRKVTVVIEPPIAPVKHNLYHCDSRFHVEDLIAQLDEFENSESHGFIVVDGNGALYGKLHGSTPQVLNHLSVSLPKKHSKGGQSAERFSRLREEARHHYLKSVAEKALKYFIDPQTTLPNVCGLVIAGSANIKDDLVSRNYLDDRLARIVKSVVVVAYGGKQGFYQAIAEVQDMLMNSKFVKEKKIITEFMQELTKDSSKAVYGINTTIRAFEMGFVGQLIVVENLPIRHVTFRDTVDDSIFVKNLNQEHIQRELDLNPNLEIVANELLLEWLVEQYQSGKMVNIDLQIVTDKTIEGRQLLVGFGGIAALLRYPMNFEENVLEETEYEEDDLSEFL